MKAQILFIIAFLIGTGAMAQTPTGLSSKAQVEQARDYVNGLINRISEDHADEFSASADYARSGPILQAKFSQKLTRFKQTMDFMVQGPLSKSIDRYNALVRETSISAGEKKLRLIGLFQSLSIQVNAAASAFQAALAQLYLVEPSWVIQSLKLINKRRSSSLQLIWFDGTREMYSGSNVENEYSEYWTYPSAYRYNDGYHPERILPAVKDTIHRHMKTTLLNVCQSQACVSGMVAAYSAYLNNVNQLVNQDLVIPLADGKSITVRCLTSNKDWGRYNDLINAVASYQFDQDYLKLPFSVKEAE